MSQNNQQIHDNKRIEKSQQLIMPLDMEVQLPANAPVRLLGEIVDRMDFGSLDRAEKRGAPRKTPGRILFGVLVFAEMMGIYSSRRIEDSCRYDVRYRWLLEGCEAPDHSTISRFRGEVLPEVAEELFGQLMHYLKGLGGIDYRHLFVDGTKQEANANRYSFVWRKSVEKRLVRLRENAASLLGLAAKDVTLEQVRPGVSQQKEKCREAGIVFVSGKGHHKTLEQKRYETLRGLVSKWEEYEKHLCMMGEGRNSYSKTDHDATFMRMKDDHMRNAQLKPGYNVQIGVSSEYIVGIGAFPNRSDSGTFVPFLESIRRLHGRKFDCVTADAGYESLENYRYLEENEQLCFIKPTNYQASKRKRKNAWISRREDMDYCPEQNVFFCQNGMALWSVGSKTRKTEAGFASTSTLYRCEDCSGCTLRSGCTRAGDGKNKQLEVNHDFARLRENSLKNISSPDGIRLRVNRAIMVESAFGVIKENYGFRRFLLRGNRKIQTELFLLAFAFNLRKLHARMRRRCMASHLFEIKIA